LAVCGGELQQVEGVGLSGESRLLGYLVVVLMGLNVLLVVVQLPLYFSEINEAEVQGKDDVECVQALATLNSYSNDGSALSHAPICEQTGFVWTCNKDRQLLFNWKLN
jgi:hypothetical protein